MKNRHHHKTLADVVDAYEHSPEGASRLHGLQQTIAHLAKEQSTTITIPDRGDCLRFAIVGDRHHGNLCCDVSAIAAFSAEVERLGITDVLDAGDMLDGHGVYRGQEFELKHVGFEAQAKAFAAESPQGSFTTHFITGNHDASFTRRVGVSVGDRLSADRPDFHFLGADTASVELKNESGTRCRIQLIHPDGGTAYALSYKVQKIVEQLEGGSKPDILAVGHFHKAEFIPQYRNVAVFQTGTFERQTPFMARNGLSAHVGGWIVEYCRGKSANRVRAEFISFY
jgi:hypothetical protein